MVILQGVLILLGTGALVLGIRLFYRTLSYYEAPASYEVIVYSVCMLVGFSMLVAGLTTNANKSPDEIAYDRQVEQLKIEHCYGPNHLTEFCRPSKTGELSVED